MFSRRKGERAVEAPRDADLLERVQEIVREELTELVDHGRVIVEEREPEGERPAEIDLRPTRQGTTPVHMSIYDDTVTFGVGRAGAWDEIWSTSSAWASVVRDRIRSVRDGHYEELVSKGWFFPLKVEMRFGAQGDADESVGRVRYASTLSSADGELPMPPTGEFRYGAW